VSAILFERVGDESKHLLIFVKQQARRKVAKPLVRKSRRGKELEALDLAKMRPLAKGEEI
jgi:hypothetical protein